MMKRVGLAGLMAAMAVAMFHPAVASAQDRYDYRHGYVREYRDRDRDWRRDERWRAEQYREARERQEWREREWRDRERYARPYSYGYRPPVVDFGYYGR